MTDAPGEPTQTEVLAPSALHPRGLPGPGEEFGHYKIVRVLGEGGMGAVFEAQDLENGRQVALKVLSHTLDSPAARQRFFREGRLAASLNHPNSVYVFGTEEVGGIPVIAMELVGGGTLQERVRLLGPLPPAEAVDAVLQIIAGLEAAQKLGILHRDIKPSNCFVAPGGVVKVGDFGLSISTAIRLEPSLTATGSFLGTPAFSSPEQLRGDELTFRADMYSVGATLFYLLTGRTPFEGKTEVQLLAAVLEQRPPSPRQFRAQIPRGLAKGVLRCLHKEPGERFKNYRELAEALAPYGTSAPTPATLGLRFGAGVLDTTLLGITITAVNLVWFNPVELLTRVSKGDPAALAWMALGLFGWVLYYSLFESIRGATPGKMLLGLRVVSPGNSPPSFPRALVRALMYVVMPALPHWLLFATGVYNSFDSFALQQGAGLLLYIVLAMLFVTARRRNGFAAVHDLLTGTRVVSRTALQARAAMALPQLKPPQVDMRAKLGPFHILETLASSPAGDWLLGYDLCLLRKVWLHKVPPGTPPTPLTLRNLSRPARLRWLGGRRLPNENWDAYEALTGSPLLTLARHPQPWSQVRFWLHDLASELAAARNDQSVPPVLSPDRVWITAEGRAKLLDFPAPGCEYSSLSSATTLSAELNAGGPPPLPDFEPCKLFLLQIAAISLNRTAAAQRPPDPVPKAPLPLHARTFLTRLAQFPNLEAITLALKPLLTRVAAVSRGRRMAMVAGCLLLPVLAGVGFIMGISIAQQWATSGVMELNAVLHARQSATSGLLSSRPHPTDQQFAVFIATHYSSVITNQDTWASPFVKSMIGKKGCAFAEQSLAQYPNPSPQEREDAERAVRPYAAAAQSIDLQKQPWFPVFFMLGTLGVYVGIPALLAALLFRGGLILLAAGVAYVRGDGERASRLRVFWRAVVAWSVIPVAGAAYLLAGFGGGQLWAVLVGSVVLFGLVVVSLWLPDRGLPERLSGTWPVPK
jgi:uncharacterized RDD family membrane protein YckC